MPEDKGFFPTAILTQEAMDIWALGFNFQVAVTTFLKYRDNTTCLASALPAEHLEIIYSWEGKRYAYEKPMVLGVPIRQQAEELLTMCLLINEGRT